MLSGKTYEELKKGLDLLGVDSEFTVTGTGAVTVPVETMQALVSLSQEGKLSTPQCMECGTAHEVMFGKRDGRLVAYCFVCQPADVTDGWE